MTYDALKLFEDEFNNVERIAAQRIGRETVQYVSNIYKYYVAYQLAYAEIQARRDRK